MKKLLRIIIFLIKHPNFKREYGMPFFRFLYFQLIAKRSDFIFNFYGSSRLNIKKGFPSSTGTFYTRLYDFDDMNFLLRYLKRGDAFIDVGANVGIYSILAAVELDCTVHSFEPDPKTYKELEYNITINNISNNYSYCLGLSHTNESLFLTSNKGAANHVTDDPSNSTKISLRALDSFRIDAEFIKIDVEGFEFFVIKGGLNTISKVNVILIELKGHGTKYGIDEVEIHRMLRDMGFSPFCYLPHENRLQSIVNSEENYIYIRDIERAQKRLI